MSGAGNTTVEFLSTATSTRAAGHQQPGVVDRRLRVSGPVVTEEDQGVPRDARGDGGSPDQRGVRRGVLASNFWLYWRTMFAFEEWHSALEMKLYLHRFIHTVMLRRFE
jgi:hypothetical protein